MNPQVQKYLDDKLKCLAPLYADFVWTHQVPAMEAGEACAPNLGAVVADTEKAILTGQAVISMLFVPAVKRVSLEYLTQRLQPDPWVVCVGLMEIESQPSIQLVHAQETIWLEWSGEELTKFQVFQYEIAKQNPGNGQIVLKARESGGEMIPDVRQFQAGKVIESAYQLMTRMLKACPCYENAFFKFKNVQFQSQ